MNFIGTGWALLPPLIAIIIALKTKEVYLSLFIGIIVSSLLVTNFHIIETVVTIFEVMISKMGSQWNAGILLFLVFLGIIVALMNKAGGSSAYANIAKKHIKTKKSALFSSFLLGIVIFVDDYFNCLTVGSVMRPISDHHQISRSKLAYIIDSSAAPICIIAPISSWAAAVSGYTSGNGFALFLQTIPFNLYALLTILMVLYVIKNDFNIGLMKSHEQNASKGDIHSGKDDYETVDKAKISERGTVWDLILPILFLIVSCIVCLLYTGGLFEGVDFVTAFSTCDASMGLVLGSFFTLVFMFILYLPRKVISYHDFADSLPEGFKTMVPAITILILAWTLGGFVSEQLSAGEFVSGLLTQTHMPLSLLPSILFVVAALFAFATGSSWGTFGILIPIITAIFPEGNSMLVISISSILAGAVCGDHISPISDTTIMASAGAQCNHVNHVSSQMPYALMVSVACIIGYLVAGFTQNVYLTFFAGLMSLYIVIKVVEYRS